MPSSYSPPRVAVIGAGLTGLTAAWELQRAGLAPIVLEKSRHVGGVIGAMQSDGWLHERGPNSMLESSDEVRSFINDLGLASRRLYAAPAAKQRYVVCSNQLIAMPTSPLGFVTTPLFSWRAKLGLIGEPWRRRAPANSDESVADFVVRRLGREFLDYAVDPFVGGVYAGSPDQLSVRHGFPKLHALEQEHGSLIRGALRRRNTSGGPQGRMFSFPNGLVEVPLALAGALGNAVRLRVKIGCIRKAPTGWAIETETEGVFATEVVDAVVCAVPGDSLAELAFHGVDAARDLVRLRAIAHPPVASVFTGYRRADVYHPLDGFGVLTPRVENGSLLGTLFSSSLFPGRAPEGYVAMTSFVGGTRQPELTTLGDEELVQMVHDELVRLLGVNQPPSFTHIQRWPRAIPQYALGYHAFTDIIKKLETAAPGLYVGGNCRDGISLVNCIASGRRLAKAARNGLARSAGTLVNQR